MDLIFGKFVTTFNNLALGEVGPDDYMTEVSKYASVICPSKRGTVT